MCMSGSEAPSAVSQMPKELPSDDLLTISKKYDQSYGDPSSPFFSEGGAVLNTTNYDGAISMYDTGNAPDNRLTISKDNAKDLHRAWVAAQRSPIMALGFDPRKMTVTNPDKGDPGLTAAGFYMPEKDQLWIDSQHKSTFVHESIHRSIEMLRKEGKMPIPEDGKPYTEEYLVRAFMLKYFGDTEKGRGSEGDAQVEKGRGTLEYAAKHLDDIEKAAAKLIAKRKPGGPR